MKWLILAYLAANTAANLILAALPLGWRPAASLVLAVLFIAFEIVSRDRLHDAWRGDPRKLGALIAGGALLAALVNYRAWTIAVASCAGFALAGAADTLAYHWLRARPWLWRSNGSNVAGALADSWTFLLVAAALGAFPWGAVALTAILQSAAKVLGGALWSVILRRRRAVPVEEPA